MAQGIFVLQNEAQHFGAVPYLPEGRAVPFERLARVVRLHDPEYVQLGFSLFIQIFSFQHMVRSVFRRTGKVQPETVVQAEHALLQFLCGRQRGILNEKPEFLFIRGGGGVRHEMIVAFPPCFPTRICDIDAVRADFWMFKSFLPD